jgi:hypothetical protein
MEIDFIQKRRKILPNRDRRFEDESPIFSTTINMFKKFLGSFDLFNFKNGQNRDFLPIHGQFFSN